MSSSTHPVSVPTSHLATPQSESPSECSGLPGPICRPYRNPDYSELLILKCKCSLSHVLLITVGFQGLHHLKSLPLWCLLFLISHNCLAGLQSEIVFQFEERSLPPDVV